MHSDILTIEIFREILKKNPNPDNIVSRVTEMPT